MAILVGSQTGRPGVLTQCAIEERRSLQLAIQGITTYAETLSVYGTEPVFVDGDDTPWSKGLLASAYASRGIKVRFTSGGGSEALMGHAGGCSMLYLEARCLSLRPAICWRGGKHQPLPDLPQQKAALAYQTIYDGSTGASSGSP